MCACPKFDIECYEDTKAASAGLRCSLLFDACAIQQTGRVDQDQPQRHVPLFSAERAIQDEWQEILIRDKTEYRVTASAGRVAIRAIGQNSASGLLRRVQVDPVNCPKIEWSWRVDQL